MIRKEFVLVLGLLLACNACGQVGSPQRTTEPIVGLPCEGCEAVFEGLPRSLPAVATIAASDEPGQAMKIRGIVRDQSGAPVPGVIVYAYHTNEAGLYPTDDRFAGQAAHRHGRLRAWAKTDQQGRYGFDTIRPGGYPNTDLPAHIHMHVIEIGRCTYYIDDIMFEDDPRLTPLQRRKLTLGRAGGGIAKPTRDASQRWVVTRDIVLGEKIPGYPARL